MLTFYDCFQFSSMLMILKWLTSLGTQDQVAHTSQLYMFHFSKCRLFANKQLRLSFFTNMVSLWQGQPTSRCEKLFSQSHSQTAPASPTVCLALVGMWRGHGLQPCKSWRSEKVNTLTLFLLCKAEEGCQPSCNIQSVLSARLPPNWRVRVGNNSPAGWLPH